MKKAELFVIALNGGWFADDKGGNLFVSYHMAERVRQKYVETMPQMHDSKIVPCGLDDDLAQMGQLYNEANNDDTH